MDFFQIKVLLSINHPHDKFGYEIYEQCLQMYT